MAHRNSFHAQQRGTTQSPLRRRLRFEALEDRRMLANVTVGNLNDIVNGTTTSIAALIATPGADGISLREAVLAANADAEADIIDFSVTGAIQLTNVGHIGQIAINNNLTINGPGASLLTIRGFAGTAAVGDGARIFEVNDGDLATFKDVSFSGLTFTGADFTAPANFGGTIYSHENTTFTECTISGNQVFGGGSRGGGIAQTFGSLTIIGCTISGNTATHGGGVYAGSGTVTIRDSTISGNLATSNGGGIVSFFNGTMTVTNSTISGNQANNSGGGISNNNPSGSLIVKHSTITGNRADADNSGVGLGGGIRGFSATTTLDHTIVAGNLRSTSPRDDINGTLAAGSDYNLVGVDTGVTGISNGTNNNQIGTAGAPIDPLLGPLANNGGPTLTHRLLTGSPAIDMGDASFMPPPDFDQRGAPFQRVVDGDGIAGARIDIGAVERSSLVSSNFVVDILADEEDDNYMLGDLSLREAILLSEFNAGVETITFAPALTSGGPATINLTSLGQLVITDSVTIDGPGADLLTIKAFDPDADGTNDGDGSRVFNIDDGSSTTMLEIEIGGLKLTGGDVNTGGGAIRNTENLTVTNSTISGNACVAFSSVGGGGIYNSGGSLTVTNSTISRNLAGYGYYYNFGDGGGIFNSGGSLTITNSTVSENGAEKGGGIYSIGGSLSLTNSTISGNYSFENGGGIFTSGGVLRHTTIAENGAEEEGGAIYSSGPSALTLDHSIVVGDIVGTVFAIYSFVGIGFGFLLGPLADNGGPTMTHALLSGSPAIDAGDPNFDPADPDGNPLTDDAVPFDQRGDPFVRVADADGAGGARIDIGAYERQTLASLNLVVDTTTDENDGDFSAGDLSLREAIDLANGFVGADTITFAAALSGATITLGGTELAIEEALVIDARPLAANLTIDANQLSRIFNITASTDDFTLGGLTLTGGRTTVVGGAIRSISTGNLTLDQSTVSGNSAAGSDADGGGIFSAGAVTLIQSTVSGNSTSGFDADGGGIYARGALTLDQSTVGGNSAAGSDADGGGIYARGALTLDQSTVSGNSTTGINADGGGIYVRGAVALTQSTVTDNHALDATAKGGGVFQFDSAVSNHPFSISGSIVAGNTAGGGGADLVKDSQSTLTVNYSLIGTGITPTTGGNNVITDDPQLGPLGNNGGPTETHALLAGSPAIDMGDPDFVGPPNFDQRGFAYSRVFGGRIDMGAFEFGAASADFDEDGDVDGLDFLAWQIGFGIAAPNAVKADGDADDDTDVDGFDLALWELQYGTPPGPLVAAVGAAVFDTEGPLLASLEANDEAPFAANRDVIDAAIAVSLLEYYRDDAKVALADDLPALVEASYDSVFDGSDSVPAANHSGESDFPATRSSESEHVEDPWLPDELLERVFG